MIEGAKAEVRRTLGMGRQYSKEEKDQLDRIVNSYRSAFPDANVFAVPELLTLDEDECPLQTSTETTIRHHNFANKRTIGRLSQFAEALIDAVQEYQQARRNRSWFTRGHWDDPRMLVLEELKRWASDRLYSFQCSRAELVEVKGRIQYLHLLSRDELVFPAGKYSELTMRSVLRNIKSQILEDRVVPEMLAEIATSSAREHLQQLETQCRLALNHGCQYLFFVLNDYALPAPSLLLFAVNNPTEAKWASVLETRSGMVTKLLALKTCRQGQTTVDAFRSQAHFAPSVMNGVKAPGVRSGTDNGQGSTSLVGLGQNDGLGVAVQMDELDSNLFLDRSGEGVVPSVFYDEFKVSQQQDGAEGQLTRYFNSNSGIIQDYRREPKTLKAFLRLHGLLFELGKITRLVEDARMLAGVGGDLLVYGLANKEVNNLMRAFQGLCTLIAGVVSNLNQTTGSYFDSLIERKGTRNKNQPWQENHQKAMDLSHDLLAELKAGTQSAEEVLSKANQSSFRERVAEARAAAQVFVSHSQSFCSNYNRFAPDGLKVGNTKKLKELDDQREGAQHQAQLSLDGPRNESMYLQHDAGHQAMLQNLPQGQHHLFRAADGTMIPVGDAEIVDHGPPRSEMQGTSAYLPAGASAYEPQSQAGQNEQSQQFLQQQASLLANEHPAQTQEGQEIDCEIGRPSKSTWWAIPLAIFAQHSGPGCPLQAPYNSGALLRRAPPRPRRKVATQQSSDGYQAPPVSGIVDPNARTASSVFYNNTPSQYSNVAQSSSPYQSRQGSFAPSTPRAAGGAFAGSAPTYGAYQAMPIPQSSSVGMHQPQQKKHYSRPTSASGR